MARGEDDVPATVAVDVSHGQLGSVDEDPEVAPERSEH
jgi:hypothetical protein